MSVNGKEHHPKKNHEQLHKPFNFLYTVVSWIIDVMGEPDADLESGGPGNTGYLNKLYEGFDGPERGHLHTTL